MREFVLVKALLTRKPDHRKAQGMVEFALAMPILLLLIYGLLEVGRLVFIYSNVVTAAREAVRYGSATGLVSGYEQYKDCAGIRQAAKNVDFLNAINNADIVIEYFKPDGTSAYPAINSATCPPASAIPNVATGGIIKVTVSGSFTPLVAIVQLSPKTLSSWGERTILGRVTVPGTTEVPAGGATKPAVISKDFLPPSIVLGEVSTLTFKLTNPNQTTPLTGVSFSDTYPSGLVNVDDLVDQPICGGTFNAHQGAGGVAFSGGSLAGYGSCTISVVVTSESLGEYKNTTEQINSVEGGLGNYAEATLAVTASAFICNNNKVVHGSLFYNSNRMTMIVNNNTGEALTISSLTVTWNNDSGHQGNKSLTLTGITLGGQSTSPDSSGPSFTFSPGWSLPTDRSTFTFTFDKDYDKQDSTELVTMDFSTPGCDEFTFSSDVNSPPVIEKTFSPSTITPGGTSLLTFTITNPNNATIGLTGIAFTDSFPSGMTRFTPPAGAQCQGSVTSTDTQITLTGGEIPAESSCTVKVLVTAGVGTYLNTSQVVTSTNGGTGNAASAALTVTPPTPFDLNVIKNGSGNGTVASNPVGINCGPTCTYAFTGGTLVSLSANPDPGSVFTGWSGSGCLGTGACNVSMSADRTVTATFNTAYTLTVTKDGTGSGTVTSSPAGVDCGATCSSPFASSTTVTLTASAPTGSTFSGWSGAGCSGTGTCVVSMSSDMSVGATFSAALAYDLNVVKSGTGTGTVTSSPAGIDCGATCIFSYNNGTAINLTAVASIGSDFSGWSGSGCSGTGNCSVTMDGIKSVTATFTKIVLPAPHLDGRQTGSNVNLSWNAVSGAQNYRIYKSIDRGTTYSPIQYTNLLTFGDSINQNQTLMYYVTAVTSSGVESVPSNIVSLTR